jgi:hypothetical protein
VDPGRIEGQRALDLVRPGAAEPDRDRRRDRDLLVARAARRIW